MNKLLKFLSGKKGVIASILGTVIAYLGTKGILGGDEVIMLGTLSAILFGSASLGTSQMYKSEIVKTK